MMTMNVMRPVLVPVFDNLIIIFICCFLIFNHQYFQIQATLQLPITFDSEFAYEFDCNASVSLHIGFFFSDFFSFCTLMIYFNFQHLCLFLLQSLYVYYCYLQAAL